MLMQSMRMTMRDWRSGELRFLLIALVVAVAALTSVGFFVDRMRAGLVRDAHQLLGADLVLRADQPIDAAWRDAARERGLALTETVAFPSMAVAGESMQASAQLASVKAVGPGYPLRGRVTIAAQPNIEGKPAAAIPEPGTVWVDPALLQSLNTAVGDVLRLGDKTFRIAGVIVTEPDRGAAFMNFAPRVMLPLADLPATGLIQPASRVRYRLLVAGKPAQVESYQQWADARLKDDSLRGMRLESLEDGRPEMRATLERAEQFLSLVGLLSAMLAAVAIAMAARRFMLRHIDSCAMLRVLGWTQRQVTQIYLIEFLMIGVAGSAIGMLVGYASHFVLMHWLGGFVALDLPAASALPALQGLLTGLLLLFGFALPPVLQLANVPHNRVIRREQQPPQPLTLVTYGCGLSAFVALLLWQAGDLKLGLLTAAGFAGAVAFFAFAAWLGLRLLALMRPWIRQPSWRFALTALQRRPAATVVQSVALALGLMALLLLTVVRGELVDGWKKATPPDAPNRFLLNIQTDQKETIEQRLRNMGVDAPQLYPMIRGRLTHVNGQPVNGSSYKEDRAKRLVEREFNLSAMAELPPQNQVVAGSWFAGQQVEASVEQGLAKTLNLQLGDRLIFDVAGQSVAAPVTSIRKLDWASMRVNFFVILHPAVLDELPQTWITAFHLPDAHSAAGSRLVRDFPNLTMIDVGGVLRQVQAVVDQVVAAVEFLFLFTLASGVLVLYAALVASQDERTREAALLRALGATRSQLSRAQWIEFLLIGGLAGMLAATGAALVGWALATHVFNFDWDFAPSVWMFGIVTGIACALLGGWFGLRGVLKRPPLQTLREA
jgi:putative ABC transport system permease protein